jgi:hypothetical protein
VLWALALEGLAADDCLELEQLVADGEASPAVFKQIRTLFQQAGAFENALRLVHEHRQKAVRVAGSLMPESLRRLTHHLIETVLQQPAATSDADRPLAIPAR